jgi:hypothetical protein
MSSTKKEVPEAVNWLGQTIKVGSLVYRGAREGNTSSYKVGIVEKITERQQSGYGSDYIARVNWRFAPGLWFKGQGFGSEKVVYSQNTYGSPDLNTVVLIDDSVWNFLLSVARPIGS